jgi:hypothetical protein
LNVVCLIIRWHRRISSARVYCVPVQVNARCVGTVARCVGTVARCVGTVARCVGTVSTRVGMVPWRVKMIPRRRLFGRIRALVDRLD